MRTDDTATSLPTMPPKPINAGPKPAIIDGMRVVTYPTAVEFLAATMAFRESEPLVTNVISTLATARANALLTHPTDLWLAVLDTAGTVVGAAVRVPPRALVVSAMPYDAAITLATSLAADPDIPGVDGPTPTSETIARTYADITGTTVSPSLDQRMLTATSIRPPDGVPGRHRFATIADRDLVVGWITRFTAEAVPDQPPPPVADIERRLTRAPTIALWTLDGAPVSICSETPPAAGVTRISSVYTPPEHRGHGYAAANVAAVSRRAIDHGISCLLYTDRSNPTSNRLYERIGYTFVADAMCWVFGR